MTDLVPVAPAEPPDFHGHDGECGEHRTVGPCRAYCLQCGEWCYPDAACKGCAHKIGQEWP